MKCLLLLVQIFLAQGICFAQPGEWVWIHGQITFNAPGVFGVQGVSNPTNNPPSFYEACEWTDVSGNFWLYGGYSNTSEFGDVWKYDPAINEWTWMKGSGMANATANYGLIGVASPTNDPGTRAWGVATWTTCLGSCNMDRFAR